MGVYHDSDGHWMDANKDLITGRALSQWWDKVMKLVQQHEFLSHLPWNVLRWNA